MAKAATKKAAPKRASASKAKRDAATAPAGGMDVQSGMDPNAEVTLHSTTLHRQFMEADARGAPEMSKEERELDEIQKGLQVRGY